MATINVTNPDIEFLPLDDPGNDSSAQELEGYPPVVEDSGDFYHFHGFEEEGEMPSKPEASADLHFTRRDYHIQASMAEHKLNVRSRSRLTDIWGVAAEQFDRRTAEADFDGQQAIALLQQKYSLDYGRKKSGSRSIRPTDHIFPQFFLDMISVVGVPGRPIGRSGTFFDNVNFSFQHWSSPYSSTHVISSLPFDLAGRTFRIATGASREIWFVVLHPRVRPATPPATRHRTAPHGGGTAVQRPHADVLHAYILALFAEGELLGLGVEESWALGDRHSKIIPFLQWTLFQTRFMERWAEVPAAHPYDDFWAESVPAFHAYDHGANIQIEVTDDIRRLPRATRLRTDRDDLSSESGSESGSENGSGSEDGSEAGSAGGSEAGGEGRAGSRAPYTGGLEKLREALELRYDLDHIEQVSYALAANLHLAAGPPPPDGTGPPPPREGQPDEPEEEGEEEEEEAPGAGTYCLLADRRAMDAQYNAPDDLAFYPMAFHPRFGNVTSARPPRFLEPLCRLLCDNADQRNRRPGGLSFGYFQGYSNVKRAIRNRPEDLLVTKGIATAALTLPPQEAAADPRVRARQDALLRHLRGELTPGRPAASVPFAREAERVREAIRQQEVAYRFEQVVTVRASRMPPARRRFHHVLQPIFELMLFFLAHRGAYEGVLRAFPAAVFPGVLCSYARVFGQALREMERRFRAAGAAGLDVGAAEAIAVLDRLGHHCFTGDPRVLPHAVLGALHTTAHLRLAAWPYVSPAVLDFRDPQVATRLRDDAWPRARHGEPVLLHVAALAYHYGPVVAANRRGQVWFAHLRRGPDARYAVGARRLVERLMRHLWIPETLRFLEHRLRRHLGRRRPQDQTTAGVDHLRRWRADLETWAASAAPFALEQYRTFFADGVRAADASGPRPSRVTFRTRGGVARDVYQACTAPPDEVDPLLHALAPAHATWPRLLRAAVRHCGEAYVSGEDWVAAIEMAMLAARIDWMPGVDRRRVTSQSLVLLRGGDQGPPPKAAHAPPGSLKRAAIQAEEDVRRSAARDHKRPRARLVDLGLPVPFAAVPPLVLEGFARLDRVHARGDPAVGAHYRYAHDQLRRHLQEPLCDLLLMLAVTLGSTASSVYVAALGQPFSLDPSPKDNAIQSAVLATRMLWFLHPRDFRMPGPSAARADQPPPAEGVLPVGEMAKKLGTWPLPPRILVSGG